MKELIGIRFILSNGAFINALLTESDGRVLIRSWKSGEFILKGKLIIGSDDYTKFQKDDWAVKVDTIMAIHTFDLTQQMQQAQPEQRRYPFQSN